MRRRYLTPVAVIVVGLLGATPPAGTPPRRTALEDWSAGRAALAVNPTEAWMLFQHACESGLIPACFAATDAEAAHLDTPLQDALQRLCESGRADACSARMIGAHPAAEVERDCEAGSAASCRRAAGARFDGVSLARDLRGAVKRFARACDLGSGLACYRLSLSYATGLGVLRDQELSASWGGKVCLALGGDTCRMDALDPSVAPAVQRRVDPGEVLVGSNNEERASYCLVAVELDAYGRVLRYALPDCDTLMERGFVSPRTWHFDPPSTGSPPYYAVVPLYLPGM